MKAPETLPPRPAATVRPSGRPSTAALPRDRRAWPEEVQAEFWRLVRELNRDSRTRGDATEGRAPLGLETAERAIREVWT